MRWVGEYKRLREWGALGRTDCFIGQSKRKEQTDVSTLKGSRILLVEDNQLNQEIILGLLENSGIEIDIANNGREAVEKFNSDKRNYDLILMDIQMPQMDGYEATRRIRERDREVPIVALTANAMREEIQKTKEAGMNDHLTKPIEVEKLLRTLLKYINPKSEATQTPTEPEEIKLPSFKHIDSESGLTRMAGNRELYLRIVRKFYENYRDLNLNNLEDEELKRTAHTIKGLSLSIGAQALSNIAKRIEESLSRELIEDFQSELKRVIEDIERGLKKEEAEESPKEELLPESRKEILGRIAESARRRRIRQLRQAIEDIKAYRLSPEDRELLTGIERLAEKRDYKGILSLLEGMT